MICGSLVRVLAAIRGIKALGMGEEGSCKRDIERLEEGRGNEMR